MLEKGGHYCRHYCTPAANPPRATLMDTLRSLVRKTFWPGEPEGRRRIVPGMPCDNHALGWSEITYPDTKKDR